MVTSGRLYYKHSDYVKGSCDCNKNGYFMGNTANELGLIGKEMTEEMYKNLREGLHPETGERLVALGPNGEHRDGRDITCSMSKEESLLYAVGNEQEKKLVDDVQRESVNRFVSYIEKDMIQARDGKGDVYKTGSILAWINDHHGNRAGETDRHTHIAIFNITKDENGSFKAVYDDGLLRREHLISVYENIKGQIWTEKGFAVEKYKLDTGNSVYSKLAGVDEKAVEVTSIRTQQIDNYIKEHQKELSEKYPDAGMGRLREIAALATRVAEKVDYTYEDIRSNTITALKDAGIEPNSVVDGIYKASELQKAESYEHIKLNEYDFVRTAAEALTKNESVFSKEQLLTVSNRLATGSEVSVEKLQNAVEELVKDKDFLHLQTVSEKGKGIVEYMTTKEMKKLERDIVKEVRAGEGKFEAVMTKDEVKTHLTDEKFSQLTNDQKNAVEFTLNSQDKVIAIDGLAGVGKTTSNAVMKELFEAKGYQVHGLAPTGVAAEKLTEVGIKAQTIDSFLINPAERTESSQNDINSKGHIFIVDEASMLGSQKFSEMLNKIDAEYSSPLIILQGDTKQLSPVQAGNPFVYLQELNAVDTLKMTETVRFKTELTKAVSDAVSNKQIDKVFSIIEGKNNLHENQNRNELIKAVVEDYTSRNNLKDSVVIAATNHDRTEINNSIREELKAQGRLTGEGRTFTTREVQNINPVSMHFAASYKEGDFLFNSYSTPEFKRGSEAKVISIDQNKNTITVEKTNGATVEIDLTKHGSNFTLYRETKTEFCKGDRILFTKNDESIGVKNGSIGTIVKVNEDGYLKIRLDNNKLTAFNVKDYQYLTTGFCLTQHKMQGGTVKEAIYYADTKNQSLNNYQAFNVAMTRAKEDITIYTNNIETLKERVSIEQNKLNTFTLSAAVKDFNRFTDQLKDELKEIKDTLAEIQSKDKETELNREIITDVKMYVTAIEVTKEQIEKEGVYEVKDSKEIDTAIKEINESVKAIETKIEESNKDIKEIAGEVKNDIVIELQSHKDALSDMREHINAPDTIKSLLEVNDSFSKTSGLIEKIEPYLNKEDIGSLNKACNEINNTMIEIQQAHKDFSDVNNQLKELKDTLEFIKDNNIDMTGESLKECREQLSCMESFVKIEFENDKNVIKEIGEKIEGVRGTLNEIEHPKEQLVEQAVEQYEHESKETKREIGIEM